MVAKIRPFQRHGSRGLDMMSSQDMPQYFTDFTWGKMCLYLVVATYVGSAAFAAVMEPWVDLPCDTAEMSVEYPNPGYIYHGGARCRNTRFLVLAGFTPAECAFARRLVASVILGGLIGWERREADRPAGIRTMSLVSLGSCLFTINSSFAFLNGPMTWDASRVSAAIPSGVGFLGAGLIFKKEEKTEDGDSTHVVHGLKTAASLWLSAAVGIACGGDLFMPASMAAGLMLLLLRFGPRGRDDTEEEDRAKEELLAQTEAKLRSLLSKNSLEEGISLIPTIGKDTSVVSMQDYETIRREEDELLSLTNSIRQTISTHKRPTAKKNIPALGSMV